MSDKQTDENHQHIRYFTVYKIMPFETALDCLRHWALKASLPHNSTNPMENLPIFKKREDSVHIFDANHEADYALMSFTQNETSPTLWGLYGDEGRGVCLRFDFPRSEDAPPQDGVGYQRYVNLRPNFNNEREGELELRSMNYDSEGERFDEEKHDRLNLESGIAIMLHKSNVWAFEKEYRFVVQMEKASLFAENKFYYITPMRYLRQVILGPKCTYSPAFVRARFKIYAQDAHADSHFGISNISFVRATYHETDFSINIPTLPQL